MSLFQTYDVIDHFISTHEWLNTVLFSPRFWFVHTVFALARFLNKRWRSVAIECNTGKLFSLTRCSALPAVFHTADSNHSTRKGRSLTLDLLATSHEDRYSFTAFYSKPSFPGLFTLPPSTFSFSFWEREFLGSTLYNLLQKELVQNCR